MRRSRELCDAVAFEHALPVCPGGEVLEAGDAVVERLDADDGVLHQHQRCHTSAVGRSRLEVNLRLADLIRAAGRAGTRSYAAYSFVAMHTRHLMGELEVSGDIALLSTALLAPLEVPILEQQVRIEGIHVDRIVEAWTVLAHRITQR